MMKRRALSFILVVVIALGLLPGNVLAETDTQSAISRVYASGTSGSCNWTLYDSGDLLFTGTGPIGGGWNSVNPSPWEGMPVKRAIFSEGITDIGENAFRDNTTITAAIIPVSVTKIEDYAFDGWHSGHFQTYYAGTREQWNNISYNGQHNQWFSGDNRVHYECAPLTVAFDTGNDTPVVPDQISVIQGTVYGILPLPQWDGHTFDGWFTDVYEGGQIYTDTIVDLAGNTTLYAHWLDAYTVTFDYNGGAADTNVTKVVTPGKTYGKLPVPTREYYAFDGWYTDPVAGIRINEDTEVNLDDDQTLYAHWRSTAERYTVFFDANGGDAVSPGSITVTQGSTYGSLPIPVRTNYLFDGWFTSVNGGVLITDQTVVNLTGDRTLFAHWSYNASAYTVTFDLNGGDAVDPEYISVVHGEPYGTLPIPLRTNYTFDGWYTEPSGGTRIQSDTTVNFVENQTLYAHWVYFAPSYTVSFDANGGDAVSPNEITVLQGETYGALPTPTRTNYRFDGWYTSADGGMRITAQSTVDLSGDQTLFAHWSYVAPTYIISFEPNGGNAVSPANITVTLGETYGTLPTANRTDHRFDGWYTEPEGGSRVYSSTIVKLTGNQTLYAHWTYVASSYTVTFDVNGGGSVSPASITVSQGSVYGALPTPSRTNYSFAGWYTSPSSGKQIYSSTEVNLTGNQTLYAHWIYVAPSYIVFFNSNGGDAVSPASVIVKQGEPYGTMPTPSRTSYSFDGWFTAVSGGIQIKADTVVNLSANTTLYAHWSEIVSPPFVREPSLADLSYSFSNSYNGLGYSRGYQIPLSRFQMIYGNSMLAKMLWIDYGKWQGSCYGFSATSSIFFEEGNNVTASDFKAGATSPSELTTSNKNTSLNLTVREFLEVMQISQFDELIQRKFHEQADLNDLCQAVSDFSASGQEPVIIGIFGKVGGHALLGYRLEKVSDLTSRLYVYDSNYPHTERFITLTTNSSGNYTGWYYPLNDVYNYGSAYAGSGLNYVLYSDVMSVWQNRARQTGQAAEVLTVNQDITIRDTDGNAIASIEDGTLTTGRDDIYPIVEVGIPADGPLSDSVRTSVYLPADLYIVERTGDASLMDSEPFELTMTHVEQSASVSTNAGKVTVAVDDVSRINYISIDEKGSEYDIILNTTLEDAENKELHLTGTVRDKVVSLMQSDGVMGYSGITTGNAMIDGTELYVDGRLYTLQAVGDTSVPIISFQANGGGGAMSPQTASADGCFTFPKCEFIPPKGKVFLSWSMNGMTYDVGDRVILTENTTVIAQWTSSGRTGHIQSVSIEDGVAIVSVEGSSSAGTVVVAAYEASGKMLSTGTARLNGDGRYEINIDIAGADTITAFLLDSYERPMGSKYSVPLK